MLSLSVGPEEPALIMVATTLDCADGGVARSTPLLAEAVAGTGLPVRLIGRVFSGRHTIDATIGTLDVSLIQGHGRGIMRMLPDRAFNHKLTAEVERAASQGRVVIHHPGIWTATNLAAVRAAQRIGAPVVCSPRGMMDPWSLGFNRGRKRIAWHLYARRIAAASTVFHATSESEANAIRALGFQQPIAIIPNGVVLPPQPGPVQRRSGARRALFLSRIHPKKGLRNLLTAWATTRPVGWELVIAGPDEAGHRAELTRRAEELGISSSIVFHQEVTDHEKWALYRSADLFVLPTHTENFGMVVGEALACGIPAITTTGAPWAELVERDCGWWVPPDASALSDALRKAIALSDQTRTEMGLRGRQLILDQYQWAAIGARMSAVYQWLVNGGAPPPDVTLR